MEEEGRWREVPKPSSAGSLDGAGGVGRSGIFEGSRGENEGRGGSGSNAADWAESAIAVTATKPHEHVDNDKASNSSLKETVPLPPSPSSGYPLAARFPITSSALSRIPWRIGFFCLGMFILVEALAELGWTALLASAFAKVCTSVPAALFFVGYVSALACSALNNLPMTILAVKIVQHPNFSSGVIASFSALPPDAASALASNIYRAALWAIVVGSNVGANLTFVASLAGLMWSTLLRGFGSGEMDIGQGPFFVMCVPAFVLCTGGALTVLWGEFVVTGST
ncbi:hypothetical protein HK101_003480 [Irineochytrium annulatum]|nr:hypothetical protein HK101_003480 [Irineochytrium annulatum]